MRILVADDEKIKRVTLAQDLAAQGHDVATACDGEEALEQLANGRFDVVVTDLKMPGIGGMEVLRTLRKERPEIIVVIFTGYANVETAREALKNGAFDYIPKPFTPDEIKEVVRNAVKARAGNAEAKMIDLLAIVSHELKSPLATVQTTAETLYRGYFGMLEPVQ